MTCGVKTVYGSSDLELRCQCAASRLGNRFNIIQSLRGILLTFLFQKV